MLLPPTLYVVVVVYALFHSLMMGERMQQNEFGVGGLGLNNRVCY